MLRSPMLLGLLVVVVLSGCPMCAVAADAPAGRGVCSWTTILDFAVTNVGFTIGVAWIDYDGDGDLDLHFTKGSGSADEPSRLLRNEGDGTFTHIAGSALSTPGADRCMTWGDYDNDGDPDCYVTVADGGNNLFRNEGDGTFTDITTPALALPMGGGCAWADYDSDGDLDLYAAGDASGTNALFRNDGGTLVDVSAPPLNVSGATQCATWGDYDNDLDPDLYVSINGDTNRLFRNDGGTFIDVSASPLDDAGGGHGAAWGDYDNDGYLDLYLTNIFTGNRLYHNNGDGTFTDVSIFPLNDVSLNSACAWGDYDNDGYLDLYFDRAFGANVLLHNDLVYGEFHFTDVTAGGLVHTPLGGGVAWGDYDQDGDLDVVIATLQGDQPNRLVRNDCPRATNWLQVDLEGVHSNRSGIGARLRAVQGRVAQHREVSAGSGLFSQSSLTQQFGFGLASRSPEVVDTLEIRWPSGRVQTLTGLAVNQRIRVVEDSTTTGIVVSEFRGAGLERRVELEWHVSHAHRASGFFLHRAASRGGPWHRLNAVPVREGNPRRYVDREVEPLATYFYRLEAAEGRGDEWYEIVSVRTPFWAARTAELEPNRPNPFERVTEIGFSLVHPGRAEITIHDVAGRRLATVTSGSFPAGRANVAWDGRDEKGRRLPAGVYTYRLTTAAGFEARKLVLLGR